MRLREDLGTQALRQAREQSEKVLAVAQSAIELKITETREEFRSWMREQAQAIEQSMESLSRRTADELRAALRAASEEFEQRASAAGAALAQHGSELLERLLERLAQEREAHRRELEAVQVAAAAESSHLQQELAALGRRIAELDETTHHLESGLNTRLMRMSTEIVSGARTQLEGAAESLFENQVARNAKDLAQQLDAAMARLKDIHEEIEAALSESLKTTVSETLQNFQTTMDESAHRSVGRWRLALAQDLDSVARILGEHFRSGTNADSHEQP
jgi:chromosome segregation ATPase